MKRFLSNLKKLDLLECLVFVFTPYRGFTSIHNAHVKQTDKITISVPGSLGKDIKKYDAKCNCSKDKFLLDCDVLRKGSSDRNIYVRYTAENRIEINSDNSDQKSLITEFRKVKKICQQCQYNQKAKKR